MASTPLRVAMIGVGPMAAAHAAAIEHVDELALVSCASRSEDRAAEFASRFGIPAPRVFQDVAADPQADVLWIVTPPAATPMVATGLAGLGLPMLVEKPIGLTLAETRDAAAAISAPTFVGLNRRFYEVVRRAKSLVEESGGVRAIEVHMPEDLVRARPHHPDEVLDAWAFANSVHLIDLFRFFGGEVVETVSMNDASGDSFSSLLRFTSGASGVFHARWFAPGGWRVALYADDLSIVLQPIERAQVLRRNVEPEPLVPVGPDLDAKPGLIEQARGFARFAVGDVPEGTPTLMDYLSTVELVHRVTRPGE